MLKASRIPCENKSNKCDKIFIQSLIKFIETCSDQGKYFEVLANILIQLNFLNYSTN